MYVDIGTFYMNVLQYKWTYIRVGAGVVFELNTTLIWNTGDFGCSHVTNQQPLQFRLGLCFPRNQVVHAVYPATEGKYPKNEKPRILPPTVERNPSSKLQASYIDNRQRTRCL